MTEREKALGKIVVDDIFDAEDVSGPVRTCLVTDVTTTVIRARAVTTQEIIEFDRRAGISEHVLLGSAYRYVIRSTAALPPDVHEIMLSIDRKFGGGEQARHIDPRLTEEPKRGLLFISDFYPAHPLPPP